MEKPLASKEKKKKKDLTFIVPLQLYTDHCPMFVKALIETKTDGLETKRKGGGGLAQMCAPPSSTRRNLVFSCFTFTFIISR